MSFPVKRFQSNSIIKSIYQTEDEGNEAFQRRDYISAIRVFSHAIKVANTDLQGVLRTDRMLLPNLYCNRAAAYLAVKKFRCALDDCNLSLELNPDDNVHADCRRAHALLGIGLARESLASFTSIETRYSANEEYKVALANYVANLKQKSIEISLQQASNSTALFPTTCID